MAFSTADIGASNGIVNSGNIRVANGRLGDAGDLHNSGTITLDGTAGSFPS